MVALKHYQSLTAKLLLGYVSLLLLVLGTTSIISENLIGAKFVASLDENLLRQTHLIAQTYPASVADIAQNLGLRVTIINSNGEILLETDKNPQEMEIHVDRPEVKEALAKGQGFSSRYSQTLNTHLRYVALKKNPYVYRVAIPLTQINNSLKQLRLISFTATLVSIIFGSLFAFVWNKKILKPLTEITNVAENIAQGDLSARITVKSSDEIATLATSFNLMADQLAINIRDLTSEKNKLNAVITSMADGLITIDSNKIITVINPKACHLFDLKEDPIAKPLSKVIQNPEIVATFKTAFNEGVLVSKQFSLSDQEEKQIEIRSIPLKDENNQIIGAVGVIHDMTEIKRVERIRKDFVSNVSHELRTPLTSINGFIETIRYNELDRETTLHFLDIMYRESQRMINLINDLLTISRLESGHITLKKTFFTTETLWQELDILFTSKIENKGLQLIFQGKIEIYGDRDQIKQIYINLIDNAIKYSDKGLITVKAENSSECAILSVSDQGQGVASEELSRLFERFYRLDKARSRVQGGTGLGLSIVKHIAEEHGGMPFVQSNLGHGSTFGVKLPLSIFKKNRAGISCS